MKKLMIALVVLIGCGGGEISGTVKGEDAGVYMKPRCPPPFVWYEEAGKGTCRLEVPDSGQLVDTGVAVFDAGEFTCPEGYVKNPTCWNCCDAVLVDAGTSVDAGQFCPPPCVPLGESACLCPADSGQSDAGEPADTGAAPDAVSVDAGFADSGVYPDVSVPDSGYDAGVPDAGNPDSGYDAGTPDSSVHPDATAPDAGFPDSGAGSGETNVCDGEMACIWDLDNDGEAQHFCAASQYSRPGYEQASAYITDFGDQVYPVDPVATVSGVRSVNGYLCVNFASRPAGECWFNFISKCGRTSVPVDANGSECARVGRAEVDLGNRNTWVWYQNDALCLVNPQRPVRQFCHMDTSVNFHLRVEKLASGQLRPAGTM